MNHFKEEEVTVSIDGVSKYFSKQTRTVQVLENINFQLEKGILLQ